MNDTVNTLESGVCFIKTEFLVKDHERSLSAQHVAKEDLAKLEQNESIPTTETGTKKIKLESRKKLKGQNRDRRKGDGPAWRNRVEFCSDLVKANGDQVSLPVCGKNNCKMEHDKTVYLASKPPDISNHCYVFGLKGFCPWGITCRFGGEHISEDGCNIVNHLSDCSQSGTNSHSTVNSLDKETVTKLWKKKYDFSRSCSTLRTIEDRLKKNKNKETVNNCDVVGNACLSADKADSNISDKLTEVCQVECDSRTGEGGTANAETTTLGSIDDTDEIKLLPSEKKQLDWRGLLYLSPLTTVGNIPFRRICVEYGADITCSEMALALSLLQGNREWNLVKRHPSEKIFGIQICGNNPVVMTKTAQFLEENSSIDFIDINLGCPIDALYQQGCGSGMMARKGILLRTCHAMSSVLQSLPLTVKLRTGLSSSTPLAHKLMPIFKSSGVSLATVHGRSREQRYTRNADWNYIGECAEAAKPMPVFGNGDILSYEDYNKFLEIASNCSGAMIGRGALIKPWIFREIKEQKHIDISSSERFEIIRKYANYGLEHWGSDTRGVETTRRFLLEWLSFLHRYVPLGLLERPPQVINQRPPVYRGRDDMETLMASANCSDWVKISEMLLGSVPEGFVFLPKHKSNAWK